MRAINLIPSDARRAGPSGAAQVPAYVVLGVLVIAVVFVTIYVLTNNTISSRQAKLTALQTEVSQAQAEVARLGNYTQFAKLAQTREQTVAEIAQTRFDWHEALSDLSKVVPANTSLNSLTGTVVPGASSGGSNSSSSSPLRGDLTGPAFELQGCTASQDDVARLMSQLRLINNVVRVTLSQSQKSSAASGTAPVSSSGSGSQYCGPNGPTFDVLVFFKPVPGAGPTGPTSVSAAPSSTTGSSTTATPTTGSAG